MSDFDVVVVDENPLRAFVETRFVPAEGLDVGGGLAVQSLTSALRDVCAQVPEGRRLHGRRLFDLVGEKIADVDAAIDATLTAGALPTVPNVDEAWQVDRVPYWYLADFMIAIAGEYRAWREGWTDWNSRVWLTSGGLSMLSAAPVWEKLDATPIIALDATGDRELYEIVFGRPVDEYAPRVQRRGRLMQVAHRLNDRGTLKANKGDDDDVGPAGVELVDIADRLTRDYARRAAVGIKSLTPQLAKVFGADQVVHFGNLRGTNALEGVDALVVAGMHTPGPAAIMDQAVALSGDLKPFYTVDDDGNRIQPYRYGDREYRLSEAGLIQAREAFGDPQLAGVARRVGYYATPVLEALHRQHREAELVQAIHRARINVHAADVWLLTSIPTDEEVDAIFDQPPIAPDGIDWRLWPHLAAWLDERADAGLSVTTTDLVDWLDADHPEAARKRITRGRWLASIAAWRPDRWTVGQLDPSGFGGRPKSAIMPKVDNN